MKQRIKDKIEKRSTELLVLSAIIVVGGAVATASSSNILDAGASSSDGLIAEYRFDTGTGNTVHDTSGANNDGTVNGASWTSGVRGGALEFDGNDYVESGVEVDQTSGFEGFTMSAWVYPTADDSRRHVISTDNGGCDWSIHLDGDGYWNAFTGDSCGVDFQPVDLNQWQHVAIIYTENDVKFCKNGKCISRGTAPGFDSSTEDLRIGDNPDYSENWNGKIDEAKVYETALNESQIKSMYNSGAWRIGTVTSKDDPSKVAEFSFQHQNSSHVLDTSGYNNHGVIDGSASQVSTVECQVGRCYQFDNSGDKLDSVGVDINQNWTVMAWFKYPNGGLEESGHWRTLTRGDSGDHQVIVRNGGYDLGTFDNTGGQGFIDCGYDINSVSNGWHHLAMSQKQGTSGTMNFYIDGRQVCSIDSYGSTTDIRAVGNYQGGGQEFGTIDQFKVFNRSLSQAEIIEKTQGLESNGAVLDMRFNRDGGDKVHDFSGEGNHGTLQPNASAGPEWEKGVTGNALNFDGENDLLRVSDDSSFDFNKEITVGTWVKPRSGGKGSNDRSLNLIAKRQGGGGYTDIKFELGYDSNNKITWTLGVNDQVELAQMTTSESLVPNTGWHHVMATYSSKTDLMKVYKDGELIESKTYEADNITSVDTDDVWLGGGDVYSDTYYLEGLMDNSVVLPYAVSDSQVQQLYSQGESHIGSSSSSSGSGLQDGLVLSQTFNRIETCGQSDTVSCPSGMSGEVAVDESGEANHGELMNSLTEKSAGDCIVGGCVQFDESGYIHIPVDNPPTGNEERTLTAWAKLDSGTDTTQDQDIVGWGRQNTKEMNAITYGLGNSYCWGYWGYGSTYDLWQRDDGCSSNYITEDKWYHITVKYDGSKQYIYINGKLRNTASVDLNTTSTDIYIGRTPDRGANLDGSVDQVKMYNRSLSKEEVWKLYTRGRDRETGMAGPVGWWRLDSETYDATGEANHGNNQNGIRKAYVSGNLNFHADQWNGGGNNGEFDITCPGGDSSCWFEDANGNHSSLTINNGVACGDGNSGTGYIMYSSESVHQRFSSNDPHQDNAENFICVRYNNGWEYDTNTNWIDFIPVENDTLVASVDFGGDTVAKLTYYPEPVNGKVGEALKFDGSDDYVSVPHNSVLSPSKEVTIMSWVYQGGDTSNSYQRITEKGGAKTYWVDNGRDTCVRLTATEGGDLAQTCFNTDLEEDEWYHLGFSYDSGQGEVKLYVDGELLGTSNYYSGEMSGNTNDLTIGNNNGGSRPWKGKIDDVRVYPYALNSEQVKKAMNGGAVSVG